MSRFGKLTAGRATLLLALLALLFAACVQPSAALRSRPAPRDIFLPWVPQPVPTSPLPTPTPTPTPDPQAACFHDARALAFYRLLVDDPRQQRPVLDCHPALVTAAGWRAWGLAHGDPWSHCDADGVCANEYARQSGCRLPWDYASKGNNIESLTAGTGVVEIAYWSLTNDGAPDHRRHLLGEIDFFRAQRHAGIAVAEGGELGWYWVVMIATCE